MMASKRAWISLLYGAAVWMLAALGLIGCGTNNNGGVPPGPTPVAGSELVFVPDAANNILNVLVIGPDGSFNNGPVPVLGTGAEPVWAAVTPNNQFVYVTNLNGNSVSAFTLNITNGAMAAVGGSPFPAGTGPGAVAVDPLGKFAYVANNGSNNVSGYTIGSGGALTAVAGSPFPAGITPQQGIAVTAAGFVYVSNSGSSNVSAYNINSSTGALTQLTGGNPSPYATGSAPISLAMDPGGRFLFAANSNSNNVSAFTVNGDGSLSPVAGSPFAAGNEPQYLVTDRTGTHLYVVNVVDATVDAYFIASNGVLTPLATYFTGAGPEGVAMDAANKFLMVANCTGGSLSVFGVNGDGTLNSLGALSLGGCPQAVATTH
jgi:6-phosphogluconolactonase (cycloisomerase 2 family)